MKTSLFRSLALLCILSLGSLDGCKKTEIATPQVTCQTDQYVSLDGTSNANKYSYTFTYGTEGKPARIDYVYGNFDPKTAQKGGWSYNYLTPGKVVIDQTLESKHYTTITLTLDAQGRVTHREDGDVSKVMYDYEYDSQGYLAKIKKVGDAEVVITAENGFLRSAKIGSSTISITTDEQPNLKQPIPIGFLSIQWPLVSFLGKPFRGNIKTYKIGGTEYQVSINSLNAQGGLLNRELTYTDPASGKAVPYLKESYVTSCQ